MYIHACTHTSMHTHLHAAKFSYTHPCMHPRLHLYMRVFEIKASDHYEKKKIYRSRPTCTFTSSDRSYRGMFLVIILPKSYLNLHTFIHMQTSIYYIIKIKAMDLLL